MKLVMDYYSSSSLSPVSSSSSLDSKESSSNSCISAVSTTCMIFLKRRIHNTLTTISNKNKTKRLVWNGGKFCLNFSSIPWMRGT